MRRRLQLAGVGLALVIVAAVTLALTGSVTAQRPADGGAPQFQVDPWWPKPLPGNWIIGQASGVAVDRHDHVWVIHRPRSLTEEDRKSTRLNSSHLVISYAVFCLKKKKKKFYSIFSFTKTRKIYETKC